MQETTPAKYFTPDTHGFFDDLVTMLVSLSSYMFTMHVSMASNNPMPLGQRTQQELISYIAPIKILNWPFRLGCRATESTILIFSTELVMACALNGWPQFIKYLEIPSVNSDPDYRLSSSGVKRITSDIVGASFSNFYFRCEPAIKRQYGNTVDDWPEIARFAWLMRNGFAHGGSLRINDQKLRPALWKIWSIDASCNGHRCLFEDGMLGIGDVVMLMQDLDGFSAASAGH